MKTNMYITSASNKLRIWTIWNEESTIFIQYGDVGGALQLKQESVKCGLSTRTLGEQVKSRLISRVNKQYDRGYKDTPEEASMCKGLNALNLHKPMLAKPYKDVKEIDYTNAYAQRKYDGHRCLITKQDGKLTAYTRQSKIIKSIGHILEAVNIEEGMTIDGEIYCHGLKLQHITALTKKQQDGTGALRLHLYDIMVDEPYSSRLDRINLMGNAMIIPVDTLRVGSKEEMQDHYDESVRRGYEGSIIRWGEDGYQNGKRPQSIVKVKHDTRKKGEGYAYDTECKVIGIHPSKDGWARLNCIHKGKEFWVSAPGTMEEKQEVMDNYFDYLGGYIKLGYSELTEDGKPFHPVALEWMDAITI